MYDIGIIGGGTAGMTAAIYGQRAGKRTIIIEGGTFGGQITSSPNVENYPGIASVSGSEFSMNLLDQAMKLGAETQMAQVTGIRDEGEVKVIVTPEKEYPCRSIVLATGVTHRHLGVPNEERLTGAGVSYCATCDGMFFRGKEVAVVGGGNTAIQDAEFLSDYCSKVYLIHRRDEFRGENSGVKRLKEKENVEFILSATVKELVGESMVEKLILNDKKTGKDFELHVSGVFVAVGQIPKNETFADTVKLDEGGFVLASEDCLTSHPGIFAAGDCRTKEVRQLTTAAADGAVAAVASERYVKELEQIKGILGPDSGRTVFLFYNPYSNEEIEKTARLEQELSGQWRVYRQDVTRQSLLYNSLKLERTVAGAFYDNGKLVEIKQAF